MRKGDSNFPEPTLSSLAIGTGYPFQKALPKGIIFEPIPAYFGTEAHKLRD